MEDWDLILRIIGIACLVVAGLAGMYITHSIYEEGDHTFFEMWFYGMYFSLHLIPLFFYNSYRKELGLTVPLWIFRVGVVLGITVLTLRSKLG